VSYGCTYQTPGPTRVGLVPVGYGDGYARALSNRGVALVSGRRVPIRGLVCLDQLVVELTAAPVAQRDDDVVLLGRQGEEEITADELAAMVGTLNYEIVTAITPRVDRIYRRGGEVVAVECLCGRAEERGQ
jgi:alanine racemase